MTVGYNIIDLDWANTPTLICLVSPVFDDPGASGCVRACTINGRPRSLAPSRDTTRALSKPGPTQVRAQSGVHFEHAPEKMTCAAEEISYKLAEYSIELDDKKEG